MDDDNWVIVWVRKGRDYPTITCNIAIESLARRMVEEMTADPAEHDCKEVIAVCRAGDLRSLNKA